MGPPDFRFLRSVACILPAILTWSVFLAACSTSSSPALSSETDIVIFVDFTQSVPKEDFALYGQDLTNQIIPSLSMGDHLLIAPITDTTLTEFRPLVEVNLPEQPRFNGLLDNFLKYKKQSSEKETQAAQLKEKTREQVVKLFSRRLPSPETDIFSSALLAQKLFHNAHRRKVLVLMSDMIADYPPYRFEHMSWGPATTERLLTELEAKGRIPDLSGVCIYVSGASARSAELAENIQGFWFAYFQRAKANIHPSRYAHALLHWPPSQGCLPR
jgi:hypothetical protein